MKGVGVEKGLRVGRTGGSMAEQALDPYHRLGVAAADITDQAAPLRRAQHCVERRHRCAGGAIERYLAHDRVALGQVARDAAIRLELAVQRGEFVGRQEIVPHDKAVAGVGLAFGG
jgi:hypothetical protein